MESRALGRSDLVVSRLSLGSWRTFERISREAGTAVLRAARDAGITFLDDARYNDESGTAPLATGWSEVVFGGLFRDVGWPRDEVVVANKLWWEFWPSESAAEELDGSLRRMGFDVIDLAYSAPLPTGLPVEEAVSAIGALVAGGKLRAWGTVNWSAAALAAAVRASADQGVPPPCAIQLPYNLVHRDWVESPEMSAALGDGDVAVVASAVLAGGALSGKYASAVLAGGALSGKYTPAPAAGDGRLAAQLSEPRLAPAFAAARELSALAATLATTPAALALAFALGNPRVASVLFGATTPTQITTNAEAVALAARLEPDAWAALRAIGTGP
jgi:aryl-alcohol dehydrogenase-like predicted oxidoreductase